MINICLSLPLIMCTASVPIHEQRDFFATIGLHSPGEWVQFNFGAQKFKFKLDDYIKQQKSDIIQDILKQEIQNYDVYQIVHNYLFFNGYFETLKAFETACKYERGNVFLIPSQANKATS